MLECELTGTLPPTRLPEVVWRAGLDLNPLDVTNPADLAWLEALIWPEHAHRRDRLRAADRELGADYFGTRNDSKQRERYLIRQLEALGHKVSIEPAA